MDQICEKNKTESAQSELIEVLAWKSGLLFISDLTFMKDQKYQADHCYVLHTLRGIQPEQYPLKQWNDAAAYIVGPDKAFETAESAKTFLIQWLEN